MTEGQGKSNIAPLFQSGAIITRQGFTLEAISVVEKYSLYIKQNF